jgi:hypothetical protein
MFGSKTLKVFLKRQPSCVYMQFAVIYTNFAVMRYMVLHGVTWRYMVIWYFAVSRCNQMLSW